MMSNLCAPRGPLLPKKFGGEIFFHPLGLGGVVQTFPGNSPWKKVPKTGFKILGAFPQKKIWGGSKFRNFDIETGTAQGSRVTRTSNFYKW